MAAWALVENGEIKETHDGLPQNWRHVSGLYLAANDTEFLATLGWFPVVKQHQTYDTTQKIITGFDHAIVDGQVIETLKLGDRPELPSAPQWGMEQYLQQVRAERDERLRQSDWSQLPDVQSLMDDDIKERYRVYRQALRDIPQQVQQVGESGWYTPWPIL